MAFNKYKPELLMSALREAAKLRKKMLDIGITDNAGAIHSAERIVFLLGVKLNYPYLTHINKLRDSEYAIFSVAAKTAYKRGKKVLIEHAAPVRHLTRKVIELIEKGQNDASIQRYIKTYYKLVLLTPEETSKLNRQNRSEMRRNRLAEINFARSKRYKPIRAMVLKTAEQGA